MDIKLGYIIPLMDCETNNFATSRGHKYNKFDRMIYLLQAQAFFRKIGDDEQKWHNVDSRVPYCITLDQENPAVGSHHLFPSGKVYSDHDLLPLLVGLAKFKEGRREPRWKYQDGVLEALKSVRMWSDLLDMGHGRYFVLINEKTMRTRLKVTCLGVKYE